MYQEPSWAKPGIHDWAPVQKKDARGGSKNKLQKRNIEALIKYAGIVPGKPKLSDS